MFVSLTICHMYFYLDSPGYLTGISVSNVLSLVRSMGDVTLWCNYKISTLAMRVLILYTSIKGGELCKQRVHSKNH